MKYCYVPKIEPYLERIFVSGQFYTTTEEGRTFIMTLLSYLFESPELRHNKTGQTLLTKKIQKMLDTTSWTIFDDLRAEGMEKGMEKGVFSQLRETIQGLLENFPNISNEMISNITKAPLQTILAIRYELEQGLKS